MQQFKAIIFDLGGVMVSRWNATGEFSRVISHAARVEAAAAAAALEKHAPDWAQVEKGEIETPEFFKRLWPDLGVAAPFREAMARELVLAPLQYGVQLNENMLALAQGLRFDHKVGLLSNIIPEHVDFYLNFWPPLFESFDSVLFSYDLGALKPAEEVYEKMLTRLGAGASEAINIDNNPAFVEAAEEFGLKGVCFKDYNQLRAELKKRGFNIP